MDKRVSWLDLAKGVGISAVVAYHTLEGIKNSFEDVESWVINLAGFFSLWLMPMFFIVSGMLSRDTILKSSRSKIHTKMKDWLYLYLIWSVIIYGVRFLTNSITNTTMSVDEILYIIWDPVPTIWFLYALLISFFLTYLMKNIHPALVIGFALVANQLNYTYYGWFPHSIFEKLAWIYIFYAFGFYCKDWIMQLSAKTWLNIASGVGFCCVAYALIETRIAFSPMIKPLLSILFAFGFLSLCRLTSLYFSSTKLYDIGVYFGSISLFVYLTHFPFPAAMRMVLLKLDIYSPLALVIVATITALGVAALAKHLSQFVVVSYLFYRPIIFRKGAIRS